MYKWINGVSLFKLALTHHIWCRSLRLIPWSALQTLPFFARSPRIGCCSNYFTSEKLRSIWGSYNSLWLRKAVKPSNIAVIERILCLEIKATLICYETRSRRKLCQESTYSLACWLHSQRGLCTHIQIAPRFFHFRRKLKNHCSACISV